MKKLIITDENGKVEFEKEIVAFSILNQSRHVYRCSNFAEKESFGRASDIVPDPYMNTTLHFVSYSKEDAKMLMEARCKYSCVELMAD